MVLKDIYSVEREQKVMEDYRNTYLNLLLKYGTEKGRFDHTKLFEICDCQTGHAKKTYRGTLKDGIKLTERELSMVLDDGYSHFGGSSLINGRNFTVVIYTD